MSPALSPRSALSPASALFLFVARRMAAHGLDDAHATLALIAAFGKRHRRPLILMRTMMHELAQAASRNIMVAPSCCRRMTRDEARLLVIVAESDGNPVDALDGLGELLGRDCCHAPLASVQAVGQAFADLGHPIALFSR